MTIPHSFSPRRPSPWLAALWVCALLWAQGLGLVHRTVHTALPAFATATVPGSSSAHHDASGLEALLGHADHSAECRLFDQLSAGDVMVSALLAFVPVRVPCGVALATLALPAGKARVGYRARAPPLTA